MPRFYNSQSDAVVGSSRPIGRQRAAAAAKAARDAVRTSPDALARDAARRAVRVDSDLASAVERAVERVALLQGNLSAARSQIGRMNDNAFHTGTVNEAAASVRNRIAELPALIGRAEAELAEARDALDRHRAGMAAPQVDAPVDADEQDTAETVETDVEPVPAHRGRGRPPKVLAS